MGRFHCPGPSWKQLICPNCAPGLTATRPLSVSNAAATLEPDSRFKGKIKWYTTPIAFGGDAKLGENMTWVSHEEHAQLVRWWNNQYRSTVDTKRQA